MPQACAKVLRPLRLGLALSAAAWGQEACAQIDPRALYPQYRDTRIVYFDVAGRTPDEVLLELAAKGPLASDGKRVDGETQWSVTWELLDEREGRCIADVRIETTVVLPRLVGGSAFTAQEEAAWDAFIWALIDHEFGHVAISYSALSRLEAALQSGPCDGATERGKAILAETRWQHTIFDRNTRHGQLTGVRFP